MKINKKYTVTDRKKHGGKRTKPISVLIPHHNAGVASGENVASFLNTTTRVVSANYVIGQEGEIFETLDESFEPYTTGDRGIDGKGVTFELVNSTPAPEWKITDETFDALVELSIDICKRNGIKEVNYTGDKKGNINLHEWYHQTNCTGPYVKNLMPEYASRVNEGLNVNPTNPTKKTIAQLADEVNAGKWGNGKARFDGLTKAGYDAQAVQDEINRRLGIKVDKPAPVKPKPVAKTDKQLAQEVIDGKHGNGDARKKSLGDRFSAVQAEVNKILNGTAPTKPKRLTNKEVAYEIVFGKNIWGNGRERVRNLQRDGYNYEAVQREINRLV